LLVALESVEMARRIVEQGDAEKYLSLIGMLNTAAAHVGLALSEAKRVGEE
jgi:hypothetical protein